MEKKILKVPAIITKITTMHDKTIRLFVDTQEITAEDKANLMDLYDKIGMFVFAEQKIDPEDVRNLPKVKQEKGRKTPSERLRNVLFCLYKQKRITEDFEMWRGRQMEKFIEAIKDKLEPNQ